MALASPEWLHGDPMPIRFTADGADKSPPLMWGNVPEGTVSFAIVMEDPDAPLGTFTHWLICEIPYYVSNLPEGIPRRPEVQIPVAAAQGMNSFQKMGYGGPSPPPGERHRYYFRLYALDEKLALTGGYNKHQLREAMDGHILAEAELMATYER
ncbi:MAG: hypothetical protein AMK73_08990 [Planctomycetes bacterium SM23_32]|nr:MAG: hypothetical protein AMK73_08990 [Planctomycetes bacterium SM23_32]